MNVAESQAEGTRANLLVRVPVYRSPLADFWMRFKTNRFAVVSAAFLIFIHIVSLLAPWIAPYTPERIDLNNPLVRFSSDYILGTDENGRDVFARLVVGGRVSLAVGFAAALITVLVASVVGVVAGYYGGVVDQVIMRATDGFMAIPTFFLLLIIVAIWGSSPTVLVLALALTRWMGVARLVRSEVLRYKQMEFITAAEAVGNTRFRLMFKHLLPQAAPSLIVATSLQVGVVMLVEAGLSFLGLGILPPLASWGNMLTSAQHYMWIAPRLAVYPGLMILLTVLSLNAIGDLLRDVLDPRQGAGR